MTIPVPITLHLAIFPADNIAELKFNSTKELIEYIVLLDKFDCVWLITTDCNPCEIVVTESIDFMCHLLGIKSFHNENSTLYIQQYDSYEDAYATALDMIEENPKARN
jgi:hypothetical protein